MWKNIIIAACMLALATAVAWQGKTIREMRDRAPEAPAPETASGNQPVQVVRTFERVKSPSADPASSAGADALAERVAALETAVAQLIQSSEYLMSRGQLPLNAQKIAELEAMLMNPNAAERDRMQALRLLRRNGPLSDAAIQHTLAWLQNATNNGLREGLVQQLGGLTNVLVREPMIRLASSDPNADVRERAVQNLRRFLGSDPQVESLLWQMLRTEQDRGVKDQVAEALREAAVTPGRVAELRHRAVDANSSLDERLIAVQALREAGAGADDISAALAEFVQSTQNPDERARVFSAFDGATDPYMKLPLVYGLQDPNANVRARAADALSGYGSDPAVVDWLRYVAQNDSDFRVRREAEQALREAAGRGARPQGEGEPQGQRRDGPGGRGRR